MSNVTVTISKRGVHRVAIEGGILDLDISPRTAYALLLALEMHREELQDLTTNYYDCPHCGDTHHKGEQCSKSK